MKHYDRQLNPVLEAATDEELDFLVELLKTKASEMLTIHERYKACAPVHSAYPEVIATEIRLMGGNSFANLCRSCGPKYQEIVFDVAKQLKAPCNKEHDVMRLEKNILETVLTNAIDKMNQKEKEEFFKSIGGEFSELPTGPTAASAFIYLFRMGGFKSYTILITFIHTVAKQVFKTTLPFATGAIVTQAMKVLVGPVGWVLTGAWAAVDIAGPAYTVTVPAVIYIAALRQMQAMPAEDKVFAGEEAVAT
ncbi:hypothetical protein L1D19_22015 [Vibrio natriegens]|uniref:ubiquinol-cytochrome C chaperone family protein n=1 Tax=Vibrio natriegens TaxID=691 RepID=UPI001EFE6D28|nr:ubiquinol-cytochrome C chaperone family protein [Vibrio natriegens]MCG9702746.1 hypothetical protein [Vibrio natriegens]